MFWEYYFIGLVVVIGFLVVGILLRHLWSLRVDNPAAERISAMIAQGAMTFLWEEYKVISIVVAIIALILGVFTGVLASACFVIGSLLSLATGYIGMRAATRSNALVTTAAKNQGEHQAFLIALFGGGVMGFTVATFGLLGMAVMIKLFVHAESFKLLMSSFGFGASLVAFFARVGGGIYTKSADVGADLVGKIEAGIPEDDPRNPAVIADNVGDCVGDTAGMGADIYESYLGAMISSVLLAQMYYDDFMYISLPLMVAAFGLLGSVVGLFVARILRAGPAVILRYANLISIGIFLAASYCYMAISGIELNLFVSLVVGCVAGLIVGLVTEYYTSGAPIHRLAFASQSGAATNIIYGLSIAMESVVLPMILLSFGVLISFTWGGCTFGVSLAAISMLATVAMTMTIDAYGPIADNAGGIAEMAGFGKEVRAITDKLDALGNTTAAMGKGFAIGSALLAALSIFQVYVSECGLDRLDVSSAAVIMGVFIGAAMPFLISALTMRSVGDAALKMVMEVRRQFKEIPGLMEGTAQPEYERCIAISTQASLREMILPGVLTVISPVIMFFVFGKEALGGFLVGATVAGVSLALMMANGGGSWDNAKKYIESGQFGGKGSDTHKAAVVGDTVGDPFKDTSGPSLNILIKLMSMLALLLASL